jgi:hypothetical protein
VANTLELFPNGAVGFIDWLDRRKAERRSGILRFRHGRWLLVRNFHYATPLPVGVELPYRNPSQVQPHRRAVRTGHRHLVRPGHVRQFAIRRERHLAGFPMDLENRITEARRHIGADRRLPFNYRLPWENEHRVISPIRNDFVDILAGSSKDCPLRISTQQFLGFSRRIEVSGRTTNNSQSENNKQQIMWQSHRVNLLGLTIIRLQLAI